YPPAVHPDMPLEHLHHLAARGEGDRGRPVGLLQFAGMGDVLPAAAAQLLPDPEDPLRAARLRGALPGHQVGPGVARGRADDPGYRERAEVGSQMKVEGWLFLGCGSFFGGTDVVYWYTSHDPAGTTALALSVAGP